MGTGGVEGADVANGDGFGFGTKGLRTHECRDIAQRKWSGTMEEANIRHRQTFTQYAGPAEPL